MLFHVCALPDALCAAETSLRACKHARSNIHSPDNAAAEQPALIHAAHSTYKRLQVLCVPFECFTDFTNPILPTFW